jgi:predicted membrane protein
MNEPRRPPLSPSIIAGVVLIGLGVLFTLSSFGVIYAGALIDYWPLVLIIPGFVSLVWPRKHADRLWGVILMAVGGLLLLRNLDLVWFRFRHVWPIILVVFGVYLVWRAMEGRRLSGGDGGPGTPGSGGGIGGGVQVGVIGGLDATSGLRAPEFAGPSSFRDDRLDEFAVFGGGDRMLRSRSFRGGNVTAIMGGFDIDLRDADIAGDSARIEMFVLMGGVDLKVPENWTVVIDVTPFMGGADYSAGSRRPPAEGQTKVLTVTGFVCMGGIEVRH